MEDGLTKKEEEGIVEVYGSVEGEGIYEEDEGCKVTVLCWVEEDKGKLNPDEEEEMGIEEAWGMLEEEDGGRINMFEEEDTTSIMEDAKVEVGIIQGDEEEAAVMVDDGISEEAEEEITILGNVEVGAFWSAKELCCIKKEVWDDARSCVGELLLSLEIRVSLDRVLVPPLLLLLSVSEGLGNTSWLSTLQKVNRTNNMIQQNLDNMTERRININMCEQTPTIFGEGEGSLCRCSSGWIE